MTALQRILVFAEHDDAKALSEVVALARVQEAELVICDVVPSPPAHLSDSPDAKAIETDALRAAYGRLHKLMAKLTERIDVAFTVMTGNAYLEVLREVTQSGFDLLVHLRDPSRSRGADTTFAHFMRKCPCPVWGLPAGDAGQRPQLVLAVDRGREDEAGFENELATRCLQIARLFLSPGDELHLLHTWEPYGVQREHSQAAMLVDERRSAYLEQQRLDYLAWFEQACSDFQSRLPEGVTLKPHLFEGALVDGLGRLPLRRRETRLVMGTVGADAQPGLLIGGSAEAVLGQSGWELLVVKPRSFVSPLQFPRVANPELKLMGEVNV